MTKIPMARTIERAYGFTFGHFLSVIGLAWLPLLIVGIGAYFLVPPYLAAVQNVLVNRDPSAIVGSYGYVFLMMLIVIACFNMVYVAIARQVLGLRTGPAWFYFSLDSAFWRLLGAYLLMLLLIIGVTFLGAAIAGIMSVAAGAAIGGLSFFLVLLLFFYLMLRLMFFMVPVSVAEGRRVLRRSWSLSSGNFWRIFVVLLAFMVPFFIVEIILESVLFVSLAASSPPPQGSDPTQMMAYLMGLGARVYALWPILGPMLLVLYALIISLMVSAASFAYRALVPATEGIAEEFA